MRTLGQLAALAVVFLLACAAPALADHMTGRYAGAGISQGTALSLSQQGTNIAGDFSGVLNGTFYGQTDGGDFAEGFLTESGTTYPYYLNWSAAQLVITIYDTTGNQLAYVFAPEGGASTPTVDTTTRPHEPDQLQFAELSFHVYQDGAQSGPFTLDEMTGKLQSGEISGETLVWLAGTPDWVPAANINLLAEALPPPPPAETASYYVLLNGQQVGPLSADDVIIMINEGDATADDLMWTAGMEAWQPAGTFAEFAEALVPEPELPPPPPPTTQPETPPPPPGTDTPPVLEPSPPTAPDTPTAPEVPAPPTTTGGGAPLSMEQLHDLFDALAEHYGPGAGEMEKAMSGNCFLDLISGLSAQEQSDLLAANGVPGAGIMAAHPEFDGRAGRCVVTPNGDATTPTTTMAPPAAGDPFVAAVREYVQQWGLGGAEEAAITCMLSGYSVLTPAERQIMAESGLIPSPSQMKAIQDAHPTMDEDMQDCFDVQVN